MEIFGGFMVMMSILSFFMAVVWLIMPFVVFTIKGKLDRSLDILDRVEKRLAAMEGELAALQRVGRAESSVAASKPVDHQPCGTSSENSSLPVV